MDINPQMISVIQKACHRQPICIRWYKEDKGRALSPSPCSIISLPPLFTAFRKLGRKNVLGDLVLILFVQL